jgi:hypothetical protein
MFPQPPDHPETREIDIRQILGAPDLNRTATQSGRSNGVFRFGQFALAGSDWLSTYHALRIGWSGWVNIIFAALISVVGIFWTLRFFVTPEVFRPSHSHLRAKEYFYGRPVSLPNQTSSQIVHDVSSVGPGTPVAGNLAPPDLNKPGTAQPSAASNSNPSLPTTSNPGLPTSGEPTTANSTQANNAVANRSPAETTSSREKAVASNTRRATRMPTKRFAHQKTRSMSVHGILAWMKRFVQFKGRSTRTVRSLQARHSSTRTLQKAGAKPNRLSTRQGGDASLAHISSPHLPVKALNGTNGSMSGSIRGPAVKSTGSVRQTGSNRGAFSSPGRDLGATLGLGRGAGTHGLGSSKVEPTDGRGHSL